MRTLTAYSRHTHSSLLPVEVNMIYQLHNILQGMGRAEQSLLTTSCALTFASRRAGRALQLCPAPPHATLPGRQTGGGACGTAFNQKKGKQLTCKTLSLHYNTIHIAFYTVDGTHTAIVTEIQYIGCKVSLQPCYCYTVGESQPTQHHTNHSNPTRSPPC